MKQHNSLFDELQDQNNVVHDSFDKILFEEIQKQGKKITADIKRGTSLLKAFPALAEDVFNSLYKLEPTLTDYTPFGTEMNRKQVESFMESSQYESLRDYTRLDDFYSASAFSTILEEVITKLQEDEELKKLAQQQNQMSDKNKDGSPKSDKQKQQDQQQATNNANKASGKIRQAIRQGIKRATKEAEDNSETIEGLGWGSESGEFKRMSFDDKETLIKQLAKVKDMAKVIGRMKALAVASHASKIKSNQIELCGVTMGDNIAKALPQELAELNPPLLKYNFFRKFSEKQLLQYELKRNEKQGKGHIICLVDDSGSMYPNNNVLAKGAMFGLMECAKKDKRNFACDIFSSRNEEYRKEVLGGKATIQDTMDLLTASYGNGTDYDKPMEYALDLITKSEFKKADIVIITDGCCDLSPAIIKKVNEMRKETETKVIAISFDSYAKQGLSEWCDSIYTDLGDESLSEIYKEV